MEVRAIRLLLGSNVEMVNTEDRLTEEDISNLVDWNRKRPDRIKEALSAAKEALEADRRKFG